jgi:hypothetical protein
VPSLKVVTVELLEVLDACYVEEDAVDWQADLIRRLKDAGSATLLDVLDDGVVPLPDVVWLSIRMRTAGTLEWVARCIEVAIQLALRDSSGQADPSTLIDDACVTALLDNAQDCVESSRSVIRRLVVVAGGGKYEEDYALVNPAHTLEIMAGIEGKIERVRRAANIAAAAKAFHSSCMFALRMHYRLAGSEETCLEKLTAHSEACSLLGSQLRIVFPHLAYAVGNKDEEFLGVLRNMLQESDGTNEDV